MERDSTAVRGIAHPMHPAVLGMVALIDVGTPAVVAAAVLAGAAMLAFLTVDARRPAPTRSAGADPR